MVDLSSFSRDLAEADDSRSLAERLVHGVFAWMSAPDDGAEGIVPPKNGAPHVEVDAGSIGIRAYVLGAGDRCAVCPRRAECPSQVRCFHLAASIGKFEAPTGYDQRVPLAGTSWGAALEGPWAGNAPSELRGGGDHGDFAYMAALDGGAAPLGVLGVRAPAARLDAVRDELETAAFLAGAALRSLEAEAELRRRQDIMLLVNEVGSKVNAILDDALLLKQASIDIHRAFGFRNVMVFMSDPETRVLRLKARASSYDVHGADGVESGVLASEAGIVGRAFRQGATEVVDDVSRDPSYLCWFPGTKSEIAVPIHGASAVEGVLNVESDRIAAFGETERLVLETIAHQLATAVDNARLFRMVREREARYRSLVEASPVAVIHLDAEGCLNYVNPAACEAVGLGQSSLLGQGLRLESLALPTDRPQVAEAVQHAFSGRSVRDLEFRVLRAGGDVRWMVASLEPLAGETRVQAGVVVSARDRTQEKALQDRLNQSEKLSAIGTLVSGVAHELNNPLAGILGFAQLLLQRPPDTWARADLEKIEVNAKRCQRIVENLLAFARQSRMTKRRANLNEVIEGVLNLHEYQLSMDNIRVARDFDPMLPSVPIDVNRWQQVFVNLVGNAHEALRASEQTERLIRFETRRLDGKILVRICDNGPGVPPEHRRRIFEPFFTTKETGTGLGLGICFGIVREHGGTIDLVENDEAGACFAIELPFDASAGDIPRVPHYEALPPIAAGAGRHILVVDDDPYVCDVARRALEADHYEVTIAHDGKTARDLAASRPFDAVLADVRMPGELDGMQLYASLKELDPRWEERFVFMTGNLIDGKTSENLTHMSVRCIEKPFDIRDLVRVVGEALGAAAGNAP